MRQTKKGDQWYSGMKIHGGTDVKSGAAHSVTANIADIDELPKLLRDEDNVISADAGYSSDTY